MKRRQTEPVTYARRSLESRKILSRVIKHLTEEDWKDEEVSDILRIPLYLVKKLRRDVGVKKRKGGPRKRSNEEIAEMQRLRETMTLAQVGARYGLTRERIRQLTGPSERSVPLGWKHPKSGIRLANREKVAQLFNDGKSDAEIAAKLGISTAYVRALRSAAGLSRYQKHTEESDVLSAIRWFEEFGYTPSPADWTPSTARRLGQEARAIRYEEFRREFGCPSPPGVQLRHGSWSNFIRKTGLPAPKTGAAGHGRWKIEPEE